VTGSPAAHGAPVAPKLGGRTALVTGGASGMGRATSLLFARHGAHLVIAEVVRIHIRDDLLIANILAGPLVELAPSFATVVAEGGTLIEGVR